MNTSDPIEQGRHFRDQESTVKTPTIHSQGLRLMAILRRFALALGLVVVLLQVAAIPAAASASGQAGTTTNERGIQAQYGYDSADRVTAITFPAYSTHNLAFTYDPAGRPLTITAAGIGKSAQFTYNAQTKQLQSVTTTTPGPGGAPHTYTVSYELSGDGKRKSMSSSAGTVNYSWDAAGQITGLVDTLGQGTQWTYDHAGRPVTQTSTTRQGVPIVTTYSYGVSGQAGDPSTAPVYLRQITQTVNGSQLRQYTLKHSYLGQLLQRDGAWTSGRYETSTFTYDQRGRLTAETNKVVVDPAHQNPMDPLYPVSVYNANGTYTYDLSNNLNGGGGGGMGPPPMGPPGPPSGSWTYNSNNQLTSAPAQGGLPGATGLSWDPAGNLLTMNGMSFVYDIWNQLVSVGGSASGPVSYIYDILGRRDSKTVNGASTLFEYDGDALIAEKDGSGNLTRFYIWGLIGIIADAIWNGAGFDVLFYLDDDQGDTRLTVSEGGASDDAAAFMAYNLKFWAEHPDTPPMAWRSGRDDPETGLKYSGGRYFFPSTGQATQPAFVGTMGGSAYSEDGDPFWDDLSESTSAGSGLAKIARKGVADLFAMPQYQPGSKDRQQISGMMSAIPYAGSAKMVQEAISGYDSVGGRCLGTGERLLNGACALLPLFGRQVSGGLSKAGSLIGTKAARFVGWVKGLFGGGQVRVGRWMSTTERDGMIATGRVLPDLYGTDAKGVITSADPSAYRAAPAGSVYVEFDVPSAQLGPGGKEGWGIVFGPNSVRGRLAAKRGNPLAGMPNARNIKTVIP